MTYDEKTQPYEILFRFDEVTGALKGAHYKTITTVLKDGLAIAATPSDAMEVSLAKGMSGLDLAPILGTLATAQAFQMDAKDATIKGHEADIKAKDANCQALLEEVATLKAQLAQLLGGDPSTEAPASVTPALDGPVL